MPAQNNSNCITYYEAMGGEKPLPEDMMALSHCFKVRRLILAAALISGLTHVPYATAQQSFLVDGR
jgi:hypothetical protein